MPRPIRPWLRVYVEMCRDPKIRRLAPEHRWIWVAILCAARESHEPGALFVAPGVPMSTEELADFAGVKPREVTKALPLMESLSMLAVDSSGLVSVQNWAHRQFESDDVTKRTREHRERSTEQRRNVPGNASDTETETETDKDSSASADAEREFEDWWSAYPRKKGKGQAVKAYRAARKKTDANTLVEAVKRQAPTLMGRGTEFCPYPATWLNGERWADQPDNVHPLRNDEQGRLILPPLPPKSPWGHA